MNIEAKLHQRLVFLHAVVGRECVHLKTTDSRLFNPELTRDQIINLEQDVDLAERIDAFAARFGRLQDTLGDKLLPSLLTALGEKPASVIDNLDLAERLNLIASSEDWLAMRKLRNQMIHDYVDDPYILHDALACGHDFVEALIDAAKKMQGELTKRGWVLNG